MNVTLWLLFMFHPMTIEHCFAPLTGFGGKYTLSMGPNDHGMGGLTNIIVVGIWVWDFFGYDRGTCCGARVVGVAKDGLRQTEKGNETGDGDSLTGLCM